MRSAPFLATLLVAAAAVWIWRSIPARSVVQPYVERPAAGENVPICPWREPERDLVALFPQATGYTIETRILSALMTPIQKRIGRPMTIDENPLRIHRVNNGTQTSGAILVKRVKGDYGGVELVIGITPQRQVAGVRIQSQREPDAIVQAVTGWLPTFSGKTADSALQPGQDLPDVASEARATAQAIAEGIRSALIVFSFAEDSAGKSLSHEAH